MRISDWSSDVCSSDLAATEDALAVYKELLKTYRPQDIGVYGTSAGGMLTAQLIARLGKEGVPNPAVIAIMAAGAGPRGASDSSYWLLGLTGAEVRAPARSEERRVGEECVSRCRSRGTPCN